MILNENIFTFQDIFIKNPDYINIVWVLFSNIMI